MWSVAMQQRNLFWSPIQSPVLHTNSPLKKRKGNRSRNAPYNCLWDGYRGRAGQLLVNIFPVPINSPKSLCEPDPGSLSFLKWRLWPPWRPIAGQLLANFFPVPINSSRSLCESYLDPVSLSFSKWPPWRHMKMIYRKEDQIPPKS